MKYVKAKKHLGQHFLTDENIAKAIVEAVRANTYSKILEIGPGTGVLTKYLITKEELDVTLVDIDHESVNFLHQTYPELTEKTIFGDFLKMTLEELLVLKNEKCGIIGNFPYNISSQILFKVYEQRELVDEVVGMFQKEVAERIASGPGSKKYGIQSVLLQAFYNIEYLFTVPNHVFDPPPKVASGVIRLIRNDVTDLGCDINLFKTVIKTAFNQRRKVLSNSLKGMVPDTNPIIEMFEKKRPEELSVQQFIDLTNLIDRVN